MSGFHQMVAWLYLQVMTRQSKSGIGQARNVFTASMTQEGTLTKACKLFFSSEIINSLRWLTIKHGMTTYWSRMLRTVQVTSLINSLPLIIVASSKFIWITFLQICEFCRVSSQWNMHSGRRNRQHSQGVCVSSILENWVQVKLILTIQSDQFYIDLPLGKMIEV